MSAEIVNESVFWLYCFLTGMAITMVYDLLRILRRVVKHPYGLVAVEDIAFWIFVSVALFLLLYHMNNGTLRWFAVFGLFAGMFFYKKIFGDFFVGFMSTIIKRILHLVVLVLSPPLKLVKSAFYKGLNGFKRWWRRSKNKLTGNIKRVKITLCKHKNVKKRDSNESGKKS
ncbi:MAG: spore cortex biosynthesis protein YabQ [Lachnospiraceae bacterium]|nr:spore cortex biosynthesis protein YabQ [Lachnospiraceae bacterium]